MSYYFRRIYFKKYNEDSFEEKIKVIDEKINNILSDYQKFVEKSKNKTNEYKNFLDKIPNLNPNTEKTKKYIEKHEQESILGKRKYSRAFEDSDNDTDNMYSYSISRNPFELYNLCVDPLTDDPELNKQIYETYLWCLKYKEEKHNKLHI
jgi:hypothetical protein